MTNEAQPPKPSQRLDSIDLLRGVVMVIMALDHVRDFFSGSHIDPTNLAQTSTALFLTRWITHFCAPVFVFLAGTAMFLSASKGKSKKELASFLVTRGLWLVFLELTVVRFGWFFNFNYQLMVGQVIWAIGWSMVALGGLIFLPVWAVTTFGILMVAVHNLFDNIQVEAFGRFDWVWMILHNTGTMEVFPGKSFAVSYPLIPWIGVMAAGYGFGQLYQLEPAQRRRALYRLGSALVGLFIVLRGINIYGNPLPWSVQPSAVFTVLSFLNCEKYPPSFLYLLMTLGPAILFLAYFDGSVGKIGQPFVTFGRVPLFYYVLHLPLINLIFHIDAIRVLGSLQFTGPFSIPDDYGYSLPVVYLVWICIVLALFPACRWFADVKRRRKDPWLSYL